MDGARGRLGFSAKSVGLLVGAAAVFGFGAAGLANCFVTAAAFPAAALTDASLGWAGAEFDVFGLVLTFGAARFALRRVDIANGLDSIAA